MDVKIAEARTYIRRYGIEAFRQYTAQHHKIEL
jgi:hypothetical protein